MKPNDIKISTAQGAKLARQIRVELRRTTYAAMRGVEANVDGNTLNLLGQVPSHYIKQLAQEIARKVASNLTIRNRLEVVTSPHHNKIAVRARRPCEQIARSITRKNSPVTQSRSDEATKGYC